MEINAATVFEEKATDGSVFYNVEIRDNSGKLLCVIGACGPAWAGTIAHNINTGSAWIEERR